MGQWSVVSIIFSEFEAPALGDLRAGARRRPPLLVGAIVPGEYRARRAGERSSGRRGRRPGDRQPPRAADRESLRGIFRPHQRGGLRRDPAAGHRPHHRDPFSRTASASTQGDILFVIDPRPYEAAVAKAASRPGDGAEQREFCQDRDASAAASSSRPARCRRNPTTSAPMPTRWRKPRFNRPQAALDRGADQCRLRLCQSADLRPHQPRRNHARQSGRLADRAAAAADLHRLRQRRLCRFRGR